MAQWLLTTCDSRENCHSVRGKTASRIEERTQQWEELLFSSASREVKLSKLAAWNEDGLGIGSQERWHNGCWDADDLENGSGILGS